jgi:hypothetical protein
LAVGENERRHAPDRCTSPASQRAEPSLSRLDRLPRSEVDVAPELFLDPDLPRAVLDATTLPDRAERAAISIDDPAQVAFLFVTRSGDC